MIDTFFFFFIPSLFVINLSSVSFSLFVSVFLLESADVDCSQISILFLRRKCTCENLSRVEYRFSFIYLLLETNEFDHFWVVFYGEG